MGSSNFLQFNPNAANQETDAGYSADATRSNGAASPSIFPSATANKLFYQLSTFTAALGTALANKGYTVSDANLSNLAGVLANIMTAADMAPYAPLANPALTGTPTAPTQAAADNSARLATTAFVKGQGYAPLASPSFTGTAFTPSPAVGDNSSAIPNTNWVRSQAYATLASPALTGTPTAPTQAAGDNSALLATTAFVKEQNYQPNLGFTPVQQGGGAGQQANRLMLGWDGASIRAQVDATDIGQLTLMSGFVGGNGYQKFPNGFILQWGTVQITAPAQIFNFPITFPNALLAIVGVDQGNPNTGTSTVNVVTVQPINGNNSSAKGFGYNNGQVATTNVQWVALGH